MNNIIFNPNSDIYLDYGYLMLPINLKVSLKIKIGAETFFSKKGYHVSLLRLKDLSQQDQNNIFIFAQKYPVKLKKIGNIFRLVTEENRQSIIVRVQLRGLKKLISAVNKQFNYNFVYPPTHITLFTLKAQHGIGVNSPDEYRRLTRSINSIYSKKLVGSFKLI